MNVPALVLPTFQRAPWARRVMFHRNREMMWKPEVEMHMSEQSPTCSRATPPTAGFIAEVFRAFPSDWVGSVYFQWVPETGWTATATIREEFMRDVCGFWGNSLAPGCKL